MRQDWLSGAGGLAHLAARHAAVFEAGEVRLQWVLPVCGAQRRQRRPAVPIGRAFELSCAPS